MEQSGDRSLRSSMCAGLRATVLGCAVVLLSGLMPCAEALAARLGLVIGNAAYADSPLKNPVNDAREIAKRLESLGFAVTKVENLRRDDIGPTVEGFASRIRPGDDVVVFYAGHGLQVKSVNYLPAVDAKIRVEGDVALNSLNLNELLERLDESKAAVKVVLLDACRNNPYARSFRSAQRGLARVDTAPSGTLLQYATRPGSVASDGDGRNGLYTMHLLAHLGTPGLTVESMFKRVSAGVRTDSSGEQEPWVEGSLQGEFYFMAPVETAGAVADPISTAVVPPVASESASLDVMDSVPETRPTVDWPPPGKVFKDCDDCPEMVVVPAGRIVMGHKDDGSVAEKANRAVTIDQPFALARMELTVAAFRAFTEATGYRSDAERNAGGGSGCWAYDLKRDPAFAFRRWALDGQWDPAWDWRDWANWMKPNQYQWSNDTHPVSCVSWVDAQAYLAWLSSKSGKTYRLPTEREWEYAALAGTTASKYWSESSEGCNYANLNDQTPVQPGNGRWPMRLDCSDGHAFVAPVGRYRANAFGLHDMLGNVAEWVGDCGDDRQEDVVANAVPSASLACGKRVLRGGAWSDEPSRVHTSARDERETTFRADFSGFRPLRVLP